MRNLFELIDHLVAFLFLRPIYGRDDYERIAVNRLLDGSEEGWLLLHAEINKVPALIEDPDTGDMVWNPWYGTGAVV